MPLDPLLIEVLACPVDKQPLLWFEDEQLLYNPRLHKGYAVRDDIPVLLVDESTDVGGPEHDRLMAKAAGGGVPETGSAGAASSESADAGPPDPDRAGSAG